MRNLKKISSFVSVLWAMNVILSSACLRAEDWKEPSRSGDFNFGALTGFSLNSGRSGWSVVGTAARKILPHGFVPDITNPVWIEAELGPVFTGGNVGLSYAAQLRWDFEKDKAWTFYAVGGLGGSSLGEFYPRFGVGALWTTNPQFQWRAELTSNLVAVGLNFPF